MTTSERLCLWERLDELRSRIERVGAPYVLLGDVALSYWGWPHLSAELEIAVELSGATSPAAWRAFGPQGVSAPVGGLRSPVLLLRYFADGSE